MHGTFRDVRFWRCRADWGPPACYESMEVEVSQRMAYTVSVLYKQEQLAPSCYDMFEAYDTMAIFGLWDHRIRSY